MKNETDWHRRAQVEEILGMSGDIHALDPLMSLFVSEKYGPAGIRERAALSLGLIGDARAAPTLIDTLQDPVEWVRSAAAWSLGEIGDTRALLPLHARALTDEPRFQARAYRALAQLGDPSGWEVLLPVLDTGDAMASTLAFVALTRIHQPAAVETLATHLEIANTTSLFSVFPALGASQDHQAIVPLRQYAQRHGNSVWTSTALVQLGDRQTIDRLVNILLSKADPVQCHEALAALAETSDPRVTQVAAGYLIDTDPVTRALAGRVLVHASDRRGAAPLIALLVQEQGDVLAQDIALWTLTRLEGPRALGGIADPALCAAMIRRLREGAVPQRVDAVQLLGVIGTADAVDPLVLALHDPHSRVRTMAAEALGKLDDPRAQTALIAALRDDASRVREQAASSLGCLHDATAVAPLIDLLRREPTQTVSTAVISTLRSLTGQDAGSDAARWIHWLEEQK